MRTIVRLFGLVLLLAGSARSAESQDSVDRLAPVHIRDPTIELPGNMNPAERDGPVPQGPFEGS